MPNTHIGRKRHRLNGLIHLYAKERRIGYPHAWLDFKARFRNTCRIDLDDAMDRFERQNRTRVNIPSFLETTGRLDTAIDVATCMINGVRHAVH